MSGESFNIEQLEYYQRINARNTFISRMVLLLVIIGMLSVNMWMSQRNYETVIINVDQTRLAQVQIMEATIRRVKRLDARLARIETQMGVAPVEDKTEPAVAAAE